MGNAGACHKKIDSERGSEAVIATLWNFWRQRDSESAACVVIDFAQHMNSKHLREIADYLDGLADDREHAEGKDGKHD